MTCSMLASMRTSGRCIYVYPWLLHQSRCHPLLQRESQARRVGWNTGRPMCCVGCALVGWRCRLMSHSDCCESGDLGCSRAAVTVSLQSVQGHAAKWWWPTDGQIHCTHAAWARCARRPACVALRRMEFVNTPVLLADHGRRRYWPPPPRPCLVAADAGSHRRRRPETRSPRRGRRRWAR